ncbi:hypothetical protein Tco_0331782 [Tanacetum coccineum]
MSTQQKRKFFKDVKHYFWEDPFHLKSVRIKLFDVVFLAKKPMTSSWLAIMVPPVDITVLTTRLLCNEPRVPGCFRIISLGDMKDLLGTHND